MLLDIVESEVACAIDNIKTNSAPGPHGIQNGQSSLASVLTKLYNKCLEEECFPDDFKLSHVIPIPKTAASKKLGNFLPKSLLNIFSKIFEKILKDKMLNFINKNNLLASELFCFTTNIFTEQAITTIHDKFLDKRDNKQYTCAIFLDI